jgi:adenosine deaminase
MFTDLHCHLGGSISKHTLFSIAYDRGFPMKKIHMVERESLDYEDYLKQYELYHKITSSPKAMYTCTYEALVKYYLKHHTGHIELRFNPIFRNANNLYDVDVIIFNVLNAVRKAITIYPELSVRIILEGDQKFSQSLNMKIAEKCFKYKSDGVVGFDISGYDKNFKLSDCGKLFEYCNNHDINLTIHSGETHVDDGILNYPYIKRIGHGIQYFLQDRQDIIEFILKNDIGIEYCPISNMATKLLTQEMSVHVLKLMHAYGVKFALCSDGYAINQPVDKICDIYNPLFTLQELDKINLNIEKMKF